MRLFALYLPQFHEIPENNKWWGDGFTEWVNVKNAKALFKGHVQPKHPLNGNYYNLLDKGVVEWQTELLKNYKIDGLIYYHYYFCGKKLLEKPAENLLKWKEIDQPFFFCWANHTWNRAWKGSREVLIEQTYGREKDWIDHFNYLLQFFKDARYEKIDNKPVFMLYQPHFDEKKPMIDLFNKLAIEAGFNGVYVIEVCSDSKEQYLKFIKQNASNCTRRFFLTEPRIGKLLLTNPTESWLKKHYNGLIYRLRQAGIIKTVEKYSGEQIYNMMIKEEPYDSEFIHGIFFEWDNTPRHGKRGYIIDSPSKETFLRYFNKLKNNDYVFINAWNEWAEGMMMEPTMEKGDMYLQWVKEARELLEKEQPRICNKV